ATDALPEEVKRLFRNCRLVGRRFRLAHVFFGRDTIEVATFRATSAPSQGEEPLADADPEDGEAPEVDDEALEAEPDEAELDEAELDEAEAIPPADAPPARIARTAAREPNANDSD